METSSFDFTTHAGSMEPSPALWADTSEPGSSKLLLYLAFVMVMRCLLHPQLLSLTLDAVM